jgi:hypothetical protein
LIGGIAKAYVDAGAVAPDALEDRASIQHEPPEHQTYYNGTRSHASLAGNTPLTVARGHAVVVADLNNVRWISHCRDLVQLPVAA